MVHSVTWKIFDKQIWCHR